MALENDIVDPKEKDPAKQKARNVLAMCIAEILGIATIVFIGCLGCIHDIYPIPLYAFAPFNFGLSVALAIQMFGHISGAHFNPAVTIAAWIMGQIELFLVPLYILAQLFGSVIGYGVILLLIPDIFTSGLCVNVPGPSVTEVQALFLELIGTSLLIFVVCTVWDPRTHGYFDSLSLKLGLMLSAIFISVAPFSGGGFNPPRSFAPAVFQNQWTSHWVYWVGPYLGGIIAPLIYKYTFLQGLSDIRKKT